MDRRQIKGWILLLLLTSAECRRIKAYTSKRGSASSREHKVKADKSFKEDTVSDEGDMVDSIKSGISLDEDGISDLVNRQLPSYGNGTWVKGRSFAGFSLSEVHELVYMLKGELGDEDDEELDAEVTRIESMLAEDDPEAEDAMEHPLKEQSQNDQAQALLKRCQALSDSRKGTENRKKELKEMLERQDGTVSEEELLQKQDEFVQECTTWANKPQKALEYLKRTSSGKITSSSQEEAKMELSTHLLGECVGQSRCSLILMTPEKGESRSTLLKVVGEDILPQVEEHQRVHLFHGDVDCKAALDQHQKGLSGQVRAEISGWSAPAENMVINARGSSGWSANSCKTLPGKMSLFECKAACHGTAEVPICRTLSWTDQTCTVCEKEVDKKDLVKTMWDRGGVTMYPRISLVTSVDLTNQLCGRYTVCNHLGGRIGVMWTHCFSSGGANGHCFEGMPCDYSLPTDANQERGTVLVVPLKAGDGLVGCAGSTEIVASGVKGEIKSITTAHFGDIGKLAEGNTIEMRRVCFCADPACEPEETETIGTLVISKACDGELWETYVEALKWAEKDCEGDVESCVELLDPLFFFSALSWDTVKGESKSDVNSIDCHAWAVQTGHWNELDQSTREFAEAYISGIGPGKIRTQACAASEMRGSVSRWIGRTMPALTSFVTTSNRMFRNAIEFIQPEKYSKTNGKIDCPLGLTIAAVVFASFGNPVGECMGWKYGNCDAAGFFSAVEEACLFESSCDIFQKVLPHNHKFEQDECVQKILSNHSAPRPSWAVEARCVDASPAFLEKNQALKEETEYLGGQIFEKVKDAAKRDLQSHGMDSSYIEDGTLNISDGVVSIPKAANFIHDICSDCQALVGHDDVEDAEHFPAEISECNTANDTSSSFKRQQLTCDIADLLASEQFSGLAVQKISLMKEACKGKVTQTTSREVCKDLSLCGFYHNSAFSALGGTELMGLRDRLLDAYRKEHNQGQSLSQTAMCTACTEYDDPYTIELDVWDSNYGKDTYLGGTAIILKGVGSQLEEGDYSSPPEGQEIFSNVNKHRGNLEEANDRLHYTASVSGGKLVIEIKSATNLRDISQIDAFVKITITGFTLTNSEQCSRCGGSMQVSKTSCHSSTKCHWKPFETAAGQPAVKVYTNYVSGTVNPVWTSRNKFEFSITDEFPFNAHQQGTGTDMIVFSETLHQGSNTMSTTFAHFQRSLSKNLLCQHLGMCMYYNVFQRVVSQILPIELGSYEAAITQQISFEDKINGHFQAILNSLNKYKCRAYWKPKNLALMVTFSWHVNKIGFMLFRMRQQIPNELYEKIREQTRKVLRGLIASGLMGSMPSYLKSAMEKSMETLIRGHSISFPEMVFELLRGLIRFGFVMGTSAFMAPIRMLYWILSMCMSGLRKFGSWVMRKYMGDDDTTAKEDLVAAWQQVKEGVKAVPKSVAKFAHNLIFDRKDCVANEATTYSSTMSDSMYLDDAESKPSPNSGSLVEFNHYAQEGAAACAIRSGAYYRAAGGATYAELFNAFCVTEVWWEDYCNCMWSDTHYSHSGMCWYSDDGCFTEFNSRQRSRTNCGQYSQTTIRDISNVAAENPNANACEIKTMVAERQEARLRATLVVLGVIYGVVTMICVIWAISEDAAMMPLCLVWPVLMLMFGGGGGPRVRRHRGVRHHYSRYRTTHHHHHYHKRW